LTLRAFKVLLFQEGVWVNEPVTDRLHHRRGNPATNSDLSRQPIIPNHGYICKSKSCVKD